MESATFREYRSPRNSDEYLGFCCGIHVLRGANIVGIFNLVRISLGFLFSLFPVKIQTDGKSSVTITESTRLLAMLHTVPMLAINVLLLVGVYKRRASYMLPYMVICFIIVLSKATAIPLNIITLLSGTKDPVVTSFVVGLLIGSVIGICLESLFLVIVYRSYRHLYGVNTTVRSKHTESHIGSKIVGAVHLILIYIAFNLCLILPLAVEKWNSTAEYYKLVAFLVLAPIGIITAILVIGLSKRRASFLMPFLVLSWVSFVFLLATTPVWAMFMTWYEDGHLVIGNVALLVVLAGAVCLEVWPLAIVYGYYCRLHKLKSEVGLEMTVKPLVVNDSKPPAYTEALHPAA